MRIERGAFLAMLLLLGCGDDAPGGITLGLPADLPASSLTDAETRALCEDFVRARNATLSALDLAGLCTASAVGETEDLATCENLANVCVGDPTTAELFAAFLEPGDPRGSCMDTAAMDLEACPASVGELEGCLNEALDAFDFGVEGILPLTCEDAATTAGDPVEAFGDPFGGLACDALPAECALGGTGMPMP